MRKLLLSLCVLAAGVGWPGLSAAQSPAPQVPQGSAPQIPQASPQAPLPSAPQAPGQAASGTESVCGFDIKPPSNLPPPGSGPIAYTIVLCWPKQDNKPIVEPGTYLYYIQFRASRPTERVWVPYDDKAEKTLLDDFKRLWSTSFLDDLSIDTLDYKFSNGVEGKIIVYNMEERERVKIVDYDGNKHVETSKIDDKLKEEAVTIRVDSFLDQSAVQKVRGIIKDLLAEKGYEFATVTPQTAPISGGSKLVHLTFKIDEGPKVKIREVDFLGNKAMSTRALRRQMKNNKGEWIFSFVNGRGTYQRAKYEEDVDKLVEYYRDQGYVTIRVGEPELKYIEDSTDRQTRWVQLRIPVAEGPRFRVASFTFDGAKIVKPEALRAIFKVQPGDWYNEKLVRKGLEKARDLYGSVGYFEFTGYPDLKPEGQPGEGDNPGAGDGTGAGPNQKSADQNPAQQASGEAKPGDGKATDQKAGAPAAGQAVATNGSQTKMVAKDKAPRVDVVMRMQEGKQYFVNRIIFQGNTTTRDNVVRREMRLVEGGVFNTEALKFSVKRINQLGYFKNVEGGSKDLDVQKTPGADNKVDITLKVEEQNRNQITFGAGVSQYEGFFGQVGFQTANFMGKGETFSVSLQAGTLAQNYQVGFTEPFLFDRNMTGGINIFKRRLEYIGQFTEASTGGDLTFGLPLTAFGRMFFNYSYQKSKVEDINSAYLDPSLLAGNPYLAEELLVAANGSRTVSKVTPSFVYNTVDNPIFPNAGKRFTASIDLAGLGGDTNFYKPSVEYVWYHPIHQTGTSPARTTLGIRAQGIYLSPFTGNPGQIPIFEKLVLGGEYSVRGFDIRSIGPKAAGSELVVGGNKSLLFNAEYQITIAGPVRLILFADAGQVRDVGEPFEWKEPTQVATNQPGSILTDPFATVTLRDPSIPISQTLITTGYQSAFKTSVGVEIRFFMPVLNVPFRLIAAYNPNRAGVLDNSYQPQKAFSFRFAVGSTF